MATASEGYGASSRSQIETVNIQEEGTSFFVFRKLIGSGSFGEIFSGRTIEGQMVAVKLARKQREIDAAVNEVMFLRKCEGATNIVQWIGSSMRTNESAGRSEYMFAMELALCSLESFMKRPEHAKGLKESEFTDLVVDCASAMKTLNEKQIAHRDIKHMNILVFNGSPVGGRRSNHLFKLCDLGGSKEVDELGLKTLVGTPNMLHPCLYAAFACGKWQTETNYSSEQCDFWSLGCTLYFCATGEFPFPYNPKNHQTYLEAARKLIHTPQAIAMQCHSNDHLSKPASNVYTPVNEIRSKTNLYPKWLMHVLSGLIRSFFHQPMLRNYVDVASAITTAPRRSFISIDKVRIVQHTDLSGDPHVGKNFPSLAACLGYREDMGLMLISNSSVTHFAAGQKSLKSLRNERFLALPMCTEFEIRRFHTAKYDYEEDASMDAQTLIRARGAMVADAMDMLEVGDELVTIVSETTTILTRQHERVLEDLEHMEESIRTLSRFSIYFEVACVPLFLSEKTSGDEQRRTFEACRNASQGVMKELDVRMEKISTLSDSCKQKLKEFEKDFVLDDPALIAIREKLSELIYTDAKDVLATHPYALKLVHSCSERRDALLRQLYVADADGKHLIYKMIESAKKVIGVWNTFRQYKTSILECVQLLEQPFQNMKMEVNQLLNKNGLNLNAMQQLARKISPEYVEKRARLREISKTNWEVAQQLEDRMSTLRTSISEVSSVSDVGSAAND